MTLYIDGYRAADGYRWERRNLVRRIRSCLLRYRHDELLSRFYSNALGVATKKARFPGKGDDNGNQI